MSWATTGSAQLLGRAQHLGQLQVGFQADLACYALNDVKFSGAHDPIAALLLCGADRAEHVMVNGEWVVKDQSLVNVNIDELQAKHRVAAKALLAA